MRKKFYNVFVATHFANDVYDLDKVRNQKSVSAIEKIKALDREISVSAYGYLEHTVKIRVGIDLELERLVCIITPHAFLTLVHNHAHIVHDRSNHVLESGIKQMGLFLVFLKLAITN